jgi:hypothetical protein
MLLVDNAMQTCSRAERYFCLDMFQVSWRSGRLRSSDTAILLEIEEFGGLLQTSVEIPPGIPVAMALPNGTLNARVSSCRKDDFGYLVEISVDSGADWFPGSYDPPYLKEKTANPPVNRPRKRVAAARSRRKTVKPGGVWKPANGGRSHR